MLEYGLGRESEARLLDDAVTAALEEAPTPDLGGTATTSDFGAAVVGFLETAARSLRIGARGPHPRREDPPGPH